MNYLIIARPLIGAGIGYVTNWIAVKMLFRPLKPIKIGKYTMPFTPGIIPKNKERIARSIGKAISENLLTGDVLAKKLVSPEAEEIIEKKTIDIINKYKEDNETIGELVCKIIDKNNYEKFVYYIKQNLEKSINEPLQEANIGELISKQIESVAKEKTKGSLLGIFGVNSIIESLSSEASNKIDEYIEKNGQNLVSKMVSKEINKLTNTEVAELLMKFEKSDIEFSKIIVNLYKGVVSENIEKVLNAIDISKIISDKIEAMNMLELETLILDIMKKELNALVNLGALIGFVLGMVNLFF